MMKKGNLYIAFSLIIILVSLPAIQMVFQPFRERPLDGAFVLADMVKFRHSTWSTGKFQEQTEKYLKDHVGFHNTLVRLQNQADYTLFNQANAEGAIIGKQKQLYEFDYIRAWLAQDSPGEEFITRKLNRVKYVQEYLKREKGIDLVIVFEPGKASFYPEFIPDKYASRKNGPSLYEIYLQKARELEVDFIDWQAYFMQLKPGSEYPLFPKYGTHWSVYGMTFAADSLLRFIEQRRGIDLAEISIDTTEFSRIPRDTDDDVAKTMNLMFRPHGEELAYPVLSIDTLSHRDKPMVLTVADSYYWNIFNTRIPKHVFANEAFWYFNSLVYPDFYFKPLYTQELDLKAEAEKQDIIFLMVTERFLHKFDWTFIDQLYSLYTPGWLKDPIYNNINDIMKNDGWFNDILARAQKENVPLGDALKEEARYMIYKDDTLNFLIDYGPEHYRRMISQDEGWMDHIRKKAEVNQVPVDEMLALDAMFVFKQDHPELFLINMRIAQFSEQIRNSPALLDSAINEAGSFRFDTTLFIGLKAKQMYRDEEIDRISQAIYRDENWLSDVRKKAEEKNISLEEMVRLDAIYVFEESLKEF